MLHTPDQPDVREFSASRGSRAITLNRIPVELPLQFRPANDPVAPVSSLTQIPVQKSLIASIYSV